MSIVQPEVGEFMGLIDVLIDGAFILAQRSLSLKFRGSRNQRIIDMKKSLETGKAVESELGVSLQYYK